MFHCVASCLVCELVNSTFLPSTPLLRLLRDQQHVVELSIVRYQNIGICIIAISHDQNIYYEYSSQFGFGVCPTDTSGIRGNESKRLESILKGIEAENPWMESSPT